jgi:hypothetical protein
MTPRTAEVMTQMVTYVWLQDAERPSMDGRTDGLTVTIKIMNTVTHDNRHPKTPESPQPAELSHLTTSQHMHSVNYNKIQLLHVSTPECHSQTLYSTNSHKFNTPYNSQIVNKQNSLIAALHLCSFFK